MAAIARLHVEALRVADEHRFQLDSLIDEVHGLEASLALQVSVYRSPEYKALEDLWRLAQPDQELAARTSPDRRGLMAWAVQALTPKATP